MKALTITALLAALALFACGHKVALQNGDLVTQPGAVPYYASLESALEAAGPAQYLAVEFYTDW